ncbi:MAG: GDP-mannose 4,6-dehydratase [Clostridia bacterium]|nr:GDP-mannose 4,6-dehydratase [Clostridia bacterium]
MVNKTKKALITGIIGQDGSYLSELLLEKGYQVYGLRRRRSDASFGNVNHIKDKIKIIYGDLTDMVSLVNAIKECMPDEIYNLAAQSFVSPSFTNPVSTSLVNGIGVINLLEAVKTVKPDTKVYQASTSEMYGEVIESPQKETTPFNPLSPYGVSKVFAHYTVKNYRSSHGLFACSGILFNHESERRGLEFVSRKITDAVAKIYLGKQEVLELGNINTQRDWGHAKDYVRAMWLMLQQDKPDDFVISTGKSCTVRDFASKAFSMVNKQIEWVGEGINEFGVDVSTGKKLVSINPDYFRPNEVNALRGDSTKAKNKIGWYPKISLETMIKDMVANDIKINEVIRG